MYVIKNETQGLWEVERVEVEVDFIAISQTKAQRVSPCGQL